MNREERNLSEAQVFFQQKKFSSAGIYARKVLRQAPNHHVAQTILADIAYQQADYSEALKLYQLVFEKGQCMPSILLKLFIIYERQEDYFNAFRFINLLLVEEPDNVEFKFKHGMTAIQIGLMDEAEESLQASLEAGVHIGQSLLNLGHIYKAKGETERAAGFYRDYSLAEQQNKAIGYWSLADLKNYTFSENDEDLLLESINSNHLSKFSKSLLLFSYSRLLEQKKDFGKAFETVKIANQLMRELRPFKKTAFLQIVKSLLNCEFIKINPVKYPSSELIPIFIVGMPRSGTTLTEQILASHSLVEPTDELPFIERIALELDMNGGYAHWLTQLPESKIESYRQQYLSQAKKYFNAESGNFIDKNPNNFLHVGLIKLLFPDAKLINVVRNATDNAMAVFKQHFSRGHDYSYSLEDICSYWGHYITLMKYWSSIYGDGIYHLCFEDLVQDPDTEISKLLDYCGLSFEPECLTFYESKRSVLTPSSSQVRRPMNVNAIGQSKKYDAFLQEFKTKLEQLNDRSRLAFFD